MPNWPKYSDPVAQRAEIEKEVKSVQKQAEIFKKANEEAEAQIKNSAGK